MIPDPSYISQGNSELDSEKSHAFNLSYSNFTQKFNINISARYSFTNNSIENVTRLMPDTEIEGLKNPTGKDVLYSTYANIGKTRYASVNGLRQLECHSTYTYLHEHERQLLLSGGQ